MAANKNYYAEELEYLRELGAEYAREHPAIAPLLATRSTDPDVERILEGTAFLCGLINERLDQNFPEIVQNLLDMTAPELLKPRPSQTLVHFRPMPQVQGVQKLEAGCQLASIPVNGASCVYTPPRDMPILPVTRATTRLENVRANAASLRLSVMSSAPVQTWWPSALRLHVHDVFGRACQWLFLLLNRCVSVRITAGGQTQTLPGSALAADTQALDAPGVFEGAREGSLLHCTPLRNYFILPEQFLFLTVSGMRRPAAEAAHQVDIVFELAGDLRLPPGPPQDLLLFNVSPAVNLFAHSTDPFVLDQSRQEYRLTPYKDPQRLLEIHSVRRVTGIKRGRRPHVYAPYTGFATDPELGVYTLRRSRSPVNGRMDHYISVLYAKGAVPDPNETLACEVLCFNHSLPLQLHEGDISVATDTSPAMVEFTNILPPSPPHPAPDTTDLEWSLFSALHANMLPLADAGALREFLELWLPARDPDPTHATLNRQRVAAVESFASRPEERLHKGRPLRGQLLDLKLRGDCFAEQGERFLFGLVLDEVLSQYATINTYTRLKVTDAASGETLEWTPRLGSRRLL